jgi:molybdenum cofactor synthesis domain-containing protein
MRDFVPPPPTAPFLPGDLVVPGAAVARFLERAALRAPRREAVPLDDALGRILAEPARALEPIPAHPRSTMDGFALASAAGMRPRRITGEILMGLAPPCAIGAGETLRIPTGGVLPEGADAVVPFEDVEETDGTIRLREAPPAFDCVTPAGADAEAGELLFAAGRRLGSAEIGMLATLGITPVSVFARPRFAIVSTGDELVDPEAPLGIGQVHDSNRFAIAASLRAMGAQAVHVPRVADTPGALRAAIESALAAYDGVFLTGGSSVGQRDLVPRIVAGLGSPGVLVHGLRVKPGKPTMLAAIDGKPVIGLPGSPASALLILEAVVRPIVAACLGVSEDGPATLAATASAPFEGRAGWTFYVPAIVHRRGGELTAEPLRIRSALASLLARSSGYVALGPDRVHIGEGEAVTVVAYAGGGVPIRSEAQA